MIKRDDMLDALSYVMRCEDVATDQEQLFPTELPDFIVWKDDGVEIRRAYQDRTAICQVCFHHVEPYEECYTERWGNLDKVDIMCIDCKDALLVDRKKVYIRRNTGWFNNA